MYNIPLFIFYTIIYTLAVNSVYFFDGAWGWIAVPIIITIFLNIFIGSFNSKIKSVRLNFLNHGTGCLAVYFISTLISIVWLIVVMAGGGFEDHEVAFVAELIFLFVNELILYINGSVCVLTTSVQLGVTKRIVYLLLWVIPVVNLVIVPKTISTCHREVITEVEKYRLNEKRKEEQVCKTRYPILMVHGIFFRDYKLLNYWGRIPDELIKNGAVIYYGMHSSADSVENCGQQLAARIKQIVEETGCEKVNIIAHSKGGLDCRAAMDYGATPYVASLTTINTPHRGCNFADYLLNKAPDALKTSVSKAYNVAASALGDINPDFIGGVSNLTASFCSDFDSSHALPENVYCQSVGSVMKVSKGGKFPLNFSNKLVKQFDGENDGLVSMDSFDFGEKNIMLKTKYKRGISHGDVIDLNHENIRDFDVREFYVQLVSDLKNRGF